MFENASPPGAPPPFCSQCLRSFFLSLSLSLPLIFFQLRGADSLDTIIQLHCGTATVAAALCKGFPCMAQGQSWVSRCGGGTEQHSYKQRGLATSYCRAPHCEIWQLLFKLLPPFSLVSSLPGVETERREKAKLSKSSYSSDSISTRHRGGFSLSTVLPFEAPNSHAYVCKR